MAVTTMGKPKLRLLLKKTGFSINPEREGLLWMKLDVFFRSDLMLPP